MEGKAGDHIILQRHRGWGRYGEADFGYGLLRLEGAVTNKVVESAGMQSWWMWRIGRHVELADVGN